MGEEVGSIEVWNSSLLTTTHLPAVLREDEHRAENEHPDPEMTPFVPLGSLHGPVLLGIPPHGGPAPVNCILTCTLSSN